MRNSSIATAAVDQQAKFKYSFALSHFFVGVNFDLCVPLIADSCIMKGSPLFKRILTSVPVSVVMENF